MRTLLGFVSILLLSGCLSGGSGGSSAKLAEDYGTLEDVYYLRSCEPSGANYIIIELILDNGSITETNYTFNNSSCSGAPMSTNVVYTGTYTIVTDSNPSYVLFVDYGNGTSGNVDVIISADDMIVNPSGAAETWVRQ